MSILKLSVEGPGEVDRIVAVLAIGLCDAIAAGAMTVSSAEAAIFSPHSAKLVKGAGGSREAVDLIWLGAELEDVEGTPESLRDLLDRIRARAVAMLARLGPMDRRAKKWTDDEAQ